jgi:hypothetical protein
MAALSIEAKWDSVTARAGIISARKSSIVGLADRRDELMKRMR